MELGILSREHSDIQRFTVIELRFCDVRCGFVPNLARD